MATPPLLKRVDVFISSPSDVGEEREAIKWAAEYLNRVMFIDEGYLLRPLEYLELVPPEMGQPAQVIVDRYLHEPDQCYLLVCVLWGRMGTPFTHPVTKQTYQSGTEYEFTKAYEAHKQSGKPLLLLYRRDPTGADDLEQQLKVKALFERVTAAGAELIGLYRQYASVDEFRKIVVQHIVQVLHAHPPEDTPATVQRPPMIEEERRLDTAIPKTARVKQPTEFWVQLCVPSSPGFRDQLPEERTSEFELSQKDIGSQSLGIVFPTDVAGLPEPTVLHVEVIAPDFEIASPRIALKVIHGRDSARLLFSLVPTAERAKSIVHVHVKQHMPEGVEVLVTAAALYVKTVSEEVASPVWSLFQSPLRTIRSLSSVVPEPDYLAFRFVGYGRRMEAKIEGSCLEAGASLFIAVERPPDRDKEPELLMRLLDMKVGSSDRIDTIFNVGEMGLKFAHIPEPWLPPALRKVKGVWFFRINREQQQKEWQFVERSRTLAIRFNENLVVGKIDRQEVITLRLASGMVQFKLILYVFGAGEMSQTPRARV
jgi:hypothetical protein